MRTDSAIGKHHNPPLHHIKAAQKLQLPRLITTSNHHQTTTTMAAAPLFTQNPRSASTAIPKHQPNHGIFRSPQFIINTQNITTVTSQPAITSQSRAPAIITEPRNVLGT
jgi:hypothetical protein